MKTWCYYTFATGTNDGWYPKGTHAGQAVCRLAARRPSGVPAGTHVSHAFHVSAGTGAGGAFILVLVLLVFGAVRRWG